MFKVEIFSFAVFILATSCYLVTSLIIINLIEGLTIAKYYVVVSFIKFVSLITKYCLLTKANSAVILFTAMSRG